MVKHYRNTRGKDPVQHAKTIKNTYQSFAEKVKYSNTIGNLSSSHGQIFNNVQLNK